MKNLKKVLALVLAFATASTMMASALVFEDIKVGSDYAEAITFLSDLGVITGKDDGKYHPDETITRAEACALIARTMTGETDVSKWKGASTFVDVPAAHWAESAIGYCVANGVVKGYGNGIFAPDKQITDEEFVAMLTRAMGYDTPAAPLAYPYGNLTAAKDKGLLDGVSVVPGSAALRGEDAQMVYNAVFADYARSSNFTNLTHGSDDFAKITIAEEVFGLKKYHKEDKNGCYAHTAVITSAKCADENTYVASYINDKTNALEGEIEFTYAYDAASLIGYEVELWGDMTHTKDNEVKAIKVMGVQEVYDWNSTMDYLDVDDVDLGMAKEVIGNPGEKAMTTKNGYSYTLFDWDNDGDVNYVDTTYVVYGKVSDLTSKTLRMDGTDGESYVLAADDTVADVKGSGLEALVADMIADSDCDVAASAHEFAYEIPADLAVGDYVEMSFNSHVFEKTVPMAMTVVTAETKSITGTDMVDGYTEFDDEIIKIADKGFYFGDTSKTYYGCDEDDDVMYDVIVDANGYVISMVESDTAYTGHLYATGWNNGKTGTGTKRDAVMSFVDTENVYSEDVVVNADADIFIVSEDDSIFADRAIDSEILVVGRVFKYAMNDDGEITKLIEIANDKKTSQYGYNMPNNYSYTDKSEVLAHDGVNYHMETAKVIFAIRDDIVDGSGYEVHGAWNTYYDEDDNVEIDPADVMAVSYDMIPDISATAKTKPWGVRYDVASEAKDEIEAAVIGVDSFTYFTGVEIYYAVISELNQKRAGYYEVEAYIPQWEGAATYNTKNDDIEVYGADLQYKGKDIEDLEALLNYFESDEGNEDAVYAEVTVSNDAIIAINVMDQDNDNRIATGEKYSVARVITEYITNNSVLHVNNFKYLRENTVEIIDPASEEYVEVTDDTIYTEITADALFLNSEDVVFADNLDGTDADDFAAGTLKDMKSYINDAKSEYVIADIVFEGTDGITDGVEIVEALYFNESVAGGYSYGDTVEKYKDANNGWHDGAAVTVGYDAEDASEVVFGLLYDGKAQDLTIKSVADGVSAKLNASKQDFTVTVPAGTDKDSYNVTVSFPVEGKEAQTATFTVVVAPKVVAPMDITVMGASLIGGNVVVTVDRPEQLAAAKALNESGMSVATKTAGKYALALSASADNQFVLTNVGSNSQVLGLGEYKFEYTVGNYTYNVTFNLLTDAI